MFTLLILALFFTPHHCYDQELIHIILNRNLIEIYDLPDVAESVRSSLEQLKRIRMSPYQRARLWDAVKKGKDLEKLNADFFKKYGDFFFDIIPEDDIAKFNLEDPEIVKLLGEAPYFTRCQLSVIANKLKQSRSLETLLSAESVNTLKVLICGFTQDELRIMPREEFEKINPEVFQNLRGCRNQQLRVLYKHVVDIYGEPYSWTKEAVAHIGMIIFSLIPEEIQTIRPTALATLNVFNLGKYRSYLMDSLTDEQIKFLSQRAKMFVHSNISYVKANSPAFAHNLYLVLVTVYLLLKF